VLLKQEVLSLRFNLWEPLVLLLGLLDSYLAQQLDLVLLQERKYTIKYKIRIGNKITNRFSPFVNS
jgi:hypothetical protein